MDTAVFTGSESSESSSIEPSAPASAVTPKAVAHRWTPRLGAKFCPVSSYFLANYHRLAPATGERGLNATEAMLVVQLVDFKWDHRAPWPTVGLLAERMGISKRQVRSVLERLEKCGYVVREARQYGPNRYHLQGLFQALEELMADDEPTDKAA
jgi:DNA-binding MarR family transcriptional regulator